MTVRNGQEFVQSAIASIAEQTLQPHEVIVVDDGSVDSTVSLLEGLREDSGVNLIVIATGGVGRAKALNIAAKRATGQWIANLDVDDAWHPQKLEYQVSVINKYPAVSVVVTDSIRVFGDAQVSFSDATSQWPVTILQKSDFYFRNPVNHSSILMRRDQLFFVGAYNESLARQIDIDLWVRFLEYGSCFYKVNVPLTLKRIHKNQSFESRHRLSYLRSALFMSVRHMRVLGAPWFYYPYPFLKFLFNLLPASIRNGLRR